MNKTFEELLKQHENTHFLEDGYYIEKLQQENEELKKNQRYYKKGVFCLENDKETMSDMIDDYKSRIEKAVEFIKEDMYSEPNELYGLIDGEHLLNILNGKE